MELWMGKNCTQKKRLRMKKTSLEFELMLCTLYGIYYQRPAQHLSARVTDSISNHKAKFKKPWN